MSLLTFFKFIHLRNDEKLFLSGLFKKSDFGLPIFDGTIFGFKTFETYNF